MLLPKLYISKDFSRSMRLSAREFHRGLRREADCGIADEVKT